MYQTHKSTAAGKAETLRRKEARKLKTGQMPVIRHAHAKRGR